MNVLWLMLYSTHKYMIISSKEFMFSPLLCFHLSAGLCKNYSLFEFKANLGPGGDSRSTERSSSL